LLTLGIPSSATMAILLGAFTINGLQPGPLLFAQHPEVAWGLIASLAVSNVILLVMALPLVRVWVSVLRIPTMVLYALTLGVMTVGAYTINNRAFDIAVMWIAGLIGLALRRLDVPLAPVALTLVLGPMLEENFRRALSIQQGSFAGFFTSPVADTAYALIVVIIVVKIAKATRKAVSSQTTSQKPVDVAGPPLSSSTTN
jgi:putative tricarboxylic transport membrane protein